jgi:hypothetical protein
MMFRGPLSGRRPRPLPVGRTTEATASLLPHTKAARDELFEALKKADRLGETRLHVRYLLLLSELDDLRADLGEDV